MEAQKGGLAPAHKCPLLTVTWLVARLVSLSDSAKIKEHITCKIPHMPALTVILVNFCDCHAGNRRLSLCRTWWQSSVLAFMTLYNSHNGYVKYSYTIIAYLRRPSMKHYLLKYTILESFIPSHNSWVIPLLFSGWREIWGHLIYSFSGDLLFLPREMLLGHFAYRHI